MVEIENKILKKAIVREFWLNGALVTEFVSMYLETEDGMNFIIHFDDENESWEIENINENPEAGEFIGDEEFKYPQVDAGEKYGINGLMINTFENEDKKNGAEARLVFEGGKELVFVYDFEGGERVFCEG